MSDPSSSTPLVLRIGDRELVVRQRYEVMSIVNDLLIAVWFIVGSVFFFSEATTTLGTWLFLIGSIELAIRPVIRFSRHLHLRRIQTSARSNGNESDQDF